jgi:hypothetical protein
MRQCWERLGDERFDKQFHLPLNVLQQYAFTLTLTNEIFSLKNREGNISNWMTDINLFLKHTLFISYHVMFLKHPGCVEVLLL